MQEGISKCTTLKNKEETLDRLYSYELNHETGTKISYSDLNYIMLGEIVELLSGMPLNEYAKKILFEPLEMKDTCYNPSDKERCAPTEIRDDETYRGLVRGAVHDETAYAMGGVAGHAGVFSTVKDMSHFIQMILGKGKYNGKKIFSEAINRPFVRAQAEAQGDDEAVKRIDEEGKNYMNHSPEWYRFNDELLIYHTITDTWTTESKSPLLAKAGAAVVPINGKWIVVNGEVKPGVRSNTVTQVEISVRTEFGWLNWTVLAVYLLGMLALGFYFMRKENGADDFFKGGGRIPWWAAGISIYATMLSAITYMTIPAKSFTTDWTYYPMLWMILLVSFPVIKYYLPYFRKLNVTSAYEILEQRFNLFTRLLASTLFCVFMIVRMAIVLYLPSLALTAVTGMDIYLCIVLMGLVTIIYCTMGGVEAVIWGDVVQGLILVGGAIFAVIYLAVNTEGGVSAYIDIALENDKFRLFDWSNSWSQATWWVIIIGGIANNLISYTSDQTVIQRYMTTPDEKSAGRGILVNGLMSVFVSVAFYMIGTGLYTFYKTHPAELDVTMGQSDAIFPFFMMSQMPVGLAGVLIAAIFAATMSTISSNINSVATAFSIDFWKRFRPSTTDHQLLGVARWSSMGSGLVGLLLALFMATWNIQSFLDFFNEYLGLLTSGLGGLFFIAVFMKRVKGYAALTGFVVGEAVVIWMSEFTDANFFLFGATGMVVSIVVAWVLSLFSPSKKN